MPVSVTTVRTRLNRSQALAVINQLPDLVSGRGSAGGLVRVLYVRVGLAVQRFLHHAFMVKALGGTDAAGTRWKPLAPLTIALRKKKGHKVVDTTKAKKERKRWWELYNAGRTHSLDAAMARRNAWATLKREGASTLGFAQGIGLTTILIDEGGLEKSLRPGVPPYAAAFAPPHVPDQVFHLQPGSVTLGTGRKWAIEQHEGRPQRQPPLPQRRLWPRPGIWPSLWWRLMLRQAQEGVRDILVYLLRR